MENIIPILQEVLATCGSFLLVIIGAFAIFGCKLLLKKMGLDITDSQMIGINSIITEVIKSLYQKYTKTIKENSSTGKLTDHQSAMIKDKAIESIKLMLSAEQIGILLKKYNAEELDDILDTLIESVLLDVKNEVVNPLDTLVDNTDPLYCDEIVSSAVKPTEKELYCIHMCPGNCIGCPLESECEYSRIGIVQE